MRGVVFGVIGLLATVAFSSPAEATPVDAWAFTATAPVLFPAFLFPYAAPTVPIGTVGIDVATTICVDSAIGGVSFVSCVGAGSCDANPSGGPNIGEGCLGPVPFFNGFGATTTLVECEMVPPGGGFNMFPLFFVAQDVDSNGVINPTLGDIVIGPSFGFGTFGPVITTAVFPFGFPYVLPGIPIHIILWDPAGLLGVWPDIANVACGAA